MELVFELRFTSSGENAVDPVRVFAHAPAFPSDVFPPNRLLLAFDDVQESSPNSSNTPLVVGRLSRPCHLFFDRARQRSQDVKVERRSRKRGPNVRSSFLG